MNTSERPFRKARQGFGVTESYCPVCGMFIAASPRPRILALAERLHRCRLWDLRISPEGSCSAEATVVAYAFGKEHPRTNLTLQREFAALRGKLTRKQPALDRWLRHSEANADLFFRDPMAALRAANLGIEEEVLKELETATLEVSQRMKAGC